MSCRQAILNDDTTMGSVPKEPDGCCEDRPWTVGSRAANKFGVFDMQGNVGEWLFNGYARDAINQLYSKGNPQGPDNANRKLIRDGSWDENRANLRSSFRNVKDPVSGEAIYGSIGFRCFYQ